MSLTAEATPCFAGGSASMIDSVAGPPMRASPPIMIPSAVTTGQ
jgi:hypothetical protein